MKSNRKSFLTSAVLIVLSFALIAGSSFALLSDTKTGNVSVSFGKVEISATASQPTLTLHLLIKTEEGTVAELTQWGTIKLIRPFAFTSNAASNAAGTTIANSDLGKYFTWKQGNGGDSVKNNGTYSYYTLGGTNQMYANVQGAYALTTDASIAGGSYATFVRGVNKLNSNGKNLWYYEEIYSGSGTDSMGGAGISAFIRNGKLSLIIKTYDESKTNHVAFQRLDYEVSGTEWTLADDGQNTIYVLAGDQLIYTITLSGEKTYDDVTCYNGDNNTNVKFAATATITAKDGTTTTVENTLVATTPTQVAVATRGAANDEFRSIEVKEFSDVTIPTSNPTSNDD